MNRRQLLAFLSAAALLRPRSAQARAPKSTPARLYIGTSGHGSKGIYVAHLENGQLTEPVLAVAAESPSFLAAPAAPAHFLYAVTQPEALPSHASSFALRPARNNPENTADSLTVAGDAASNSKGGCHLSTTRDGRCVFIANYGGASVTSFHADAQGHLTLVSNIAFPPTGHGPVKDRQSQSYAHSALPSPDEGYVLVNDLGLDCIHIFKLNPATAELTPHTPDRWHSKPGAGPRHLAFHPNGRWVYSIDELNSTIDQLNWDSTQGTLTTLNSVGTLPEGIDPTDKRACEMVFSRDHRFLYAANRVYEGFVVFTVDPHTGTLAPLQHQKNTGGESRHIAIDPSGRYFLSANQFSDDISVFPIDIATGRLGERTSQVKLGAPSCLLFT